MKKKVAILFGGQSTEHEVSLLSAASVLRNIDYDKYIVYPIGITKDGQWFQYNGNILNIENGTWENDYENKVENGQKLLFDRAVDVVFPVLHGLYGEDGTIQGMCKLLSIPCVGAGVLSSALCMDKVYTKFLLDRFGIKQAEYFIIKSYEYTKNKDNIINDIEKNIGYDLFIKPSNSGSSVGITKAHNRQELINGIDEALKYDSKVLIEKAINAKEVEVSVLGNESVEASIPGEIEPSKEFYDYEAKYESEDSELIIPARLSDEKINEIRQRAIEVYKILDCRGMARVDFLVDKNTDEIYTNEVNTIPGFTKISMYSKLWEASGKPYDVLIDELFELAISSKNI
ncbi:D-alanine--D-alanine ligase [Clostridium tepidiprofundi DSM 19306]|uniref:D-alanine--D-alanine ligase n=1 Tax=Clostridium tepidiprofundi DSM 19306 TaxID=1121338 RepID=A0A151B4X1_9CLOT|nr:D-alanine--D-alanine ligase family protein [Clostridium tepidiprofundi]KYH34936.1 D-alanine--D-alanine ligase [Clostridium tepidiprofundi DSM 19306]